MADATALRPNPDEMMPTTINRPLSSFSFPQRETVPTNWAVEEEKDPQQAATEAFAQWTKGIAMNDELFKKHVYENENLNELDLRQHRARLHSMIAFGEDLASDFLRLPDSSAAAVHVSFIDERLKQLSATLTEWHGSLEDDPTIPESFKEATREVLAGDLHDFEDELIACEGPEATA